MNVIHNYVLKAMWNTVIRKKSAAHGKFMTKSSGNHKKEGKNYYEKRKKDLRVFSLSKRRDIAKGIEIISLSKNMDITM